MERTLYSNYNLYEMYEDAKEFLMDEYPELCTLEEVDEKTHEIRKVPTDEQIWDEIYEEDSFYFKEILDNLKDYFKNKTVIFVGTLGLWTGIHDAGKIGDFEKLYYDAVKDCNYIEFSEDAENGILNLKCSHHDGTNYFSILTLTDKGAEVAEDWNYDWDTTETEQELHNRIVNDRELSTPPFFSKYY